MGTYLIYNDGRWMAVSAWTYDRFDGIKMCGAFIRVTDYTQYYIEHYATPETKELLLRSILSRRLKVILQKIDALEDERKELEKELESALSMKKDETTK